MFILAKGVTCGNIIVPYQIADIISSIVTLIKIGVPILIIVFGMLDLGKAVMAQKEDEIKKGQQVFFKRLITGVIVFFVVTIVQFVVDIVEGQGYVDADGQYISKSQYDALDDTDKADYTESTEDPCFTRILNGRK